MKLLKSLLWLPLAVACAGPDVDDEGNAPSADLQVAQSPVIVGQVDWVSSTTLSGDQAARARAVGYLSIPAARSRCTAWMVGPDLLITNNHCIGRASQAKGAQVSFNYEDGVASGARTWYDCSTFVATWKAEDMTALRCKAGANGVLPGVAQGYLDIAKTDAPAAAPLYVVHQNCDYYAESGCVPTKKLSPGKVTNVAYDALNIAYDADTLGGSSGSPVLGAAGTATAHQVIALHHWGLGGDSSGRGTGNAGVKASALRARLGSLLPAGH
jgi:hypothetical protein